MDEGNRSYKIAALYKFVEIENVETLFKALKELTTTHSIEGGLILAREGINGTIAALPDQLDAFISHLKEDFGVLFEDIEVKYSYSPHNPFFRMRLQIKKEIITMGVSLIPSSSSSSSSSFCRGIDVDPKHWNELISDPEVLLIDTRNEYEIEMGTFRNAVFFQRSINLKLLLL